MFIYVKGLFFYYTFLRVIHFLKLELGEKIRSYNNNSKIIKLIINLTLRLQLFRVIKSCVFFIYSRIRFIFIYSKFQ